MSKDANEERPCIVKGNTKQAGLKGRPTDICKDRKNGTREANNAEGRIPMKR